MLSHNCRSYKDDQGEDEGKQFFTPMSVFSQEFLDIDSMNVSAGNELCSFKSANSSPFDSPCRSIEQGLASPLLEQTVFFSQGSPNQFSKHRADDEDLLENANDSISEDVMIYHDQDSQKVAEHCDFENDQIFYPPIPEDEQDDNETNFFGYIDEDDDVDELSKFFRTSSFSSDPFHNREKSNESHKEALKNVHAHFSALVSQLLKGEGVCAGSDPKGQDWLEIISSLAWQAANFVKPDTSHGGSMDPGDYVKVKCIASGRPSDRYDILLLQCSL